MKPMPYYAEGERGVLGSILITGQWIDGLTIDLFHLPRHQEVYRHLDQCRRDGVALDLVSATGEVRDNPDLYLLLTQLPGACPTPEAAPAWVSQLRRYRHDRRVYLHVAALNEAVNAGDFTKAQELMRVAPQEREEVSGEPVVATRGANGLPEAGRPEKLVRAVVKRMRERKAHVRSQADEVLRTDSRLEGLLWFDEFQDCVMLGSRPFVDNDEQRLANWLSRTYGIEISGETLRPVICTVADDQRRDPLGEWLNGLRWDGVERIGNWLQWGMGVEDTPIRREIGRMWLVQAVARALSPGCQADAVLVLMGTQGGGKTSTLRDLVGTAFWSESEIDIGSSPRCYQQLAAAWVHELGEMADFLGSRLDQNKAKTFITSPEDKFTPLYGRALRRRKRRQVFVGTCNRPEVLRDPTGARRFWPVETGEIKRDLLLSLREQLWAEAVHQFRRWEAAGRGYQEGLSWWLPMERYGELQEIQADYQPPDAWADRIEEWLQEPNVKLFEGPINTHRLLVEAIGKELPQITKQDEMRVGDIMIKLGWRHKVVWFSALGKAANTYVRNVAPPPAL